MNKKGITLISLVITIILLLILATVAISLAVDSDGLFSKAGDAANKWNTSVADEGTKLNSLLTQMEEMTRVKTLVDLYDEGTLKIGDYVAYNPIAQGDTGEEEKYTYTSLGTVNGMAEDTEETAGIQVLKVVYEPVTPTNQTFKVDTNTKWRVLGVEGEGSARHILLISAEPVICETTGGQYYMKGAEAYENGITELNNISAIYGHGKGATGAESVNINHINKITGVTEETIPTYDQAGVYGKKYSFEGQWTPKMWIEKAEAGTVSGTCDAYGYVGNAEGLQTNETTNPETGARLYEMIFASNYWLATRGVFATQTIDETETVPTSMGNANYKVDMLMEQPETGLSRVAEAYYALFGPGDVYDGYVFSYDGAFSSDDGHEGENIAGVRPVVSLESNVTEETIKVLPDPEE